MTILIWLASGRFPIAPIGPQPAGAGANHTNVQAFFAETFGTFLFCYVVLCVSTTFSVPKEFRGFIIGSVYIAGGYAFGPLSGGILNPAITIASCLVNLSAVENPQVPLLYVLAELVGGALAACVFKFLTHAHEYEMQGEGEPQGYKRLAAPAGYAAMEGSTA